MVNVPVVFDAGLHGVFEYVYETGADYFRINFKIPGVVGKVSYKSNIGSFDAPFNQNGNFFSKLPDFNFFKCQIPFF